MSDKPDIIQCLEHYGVNFAAHRGLKILCPFHSEAVPSAIANRERNYFTCFACGVKGDVYSLLMDREGMTFPEARAFAIEQGWLDDEGGGTAPTPSGPKAPRQRVRRRARRR